MSRAEQIRAAELRVLRAVDEFDARWHCRHLMDVMEEARQVVLANHALRRALRRLTKPKPGKERSRGR